MTSTRIDKAPENPFDSLSRLVATMEGRDTRLENYILPGLRSTLVTGGRVRVFEATRHPDTAIVPHSHRFDLFSIVLAGEVTNTVYEARCARHAPDFIERIDDSERWASGESSDGWFLSDPRYDWFVRYQQTYCGKPGEYTFKRAGGRYGSGIEQYLRNTKTYTVGQGYMLYAEDIHSISFKKGTRLLIFEGPQATQTSDILLPTFRSTGGNADLSDYAAAHEPGEWVSSDPNEIMRTQPWMFQRE